MSTFTPNELTYLSEQRIGRLATADRAACASPRPVTGRQPAGRPGRRTSTPGAAAGRSPPAPCSGARSTQRPQARIASRSSSPGWRQLGSCTASRHQRAASTSPGGRADPAHSGSQDRPLSGAIGCCAPSAMLGGPRFWLPWAKERWIRAWPGTSPSVAARSAAARPGRAPASPGTHSQSRRG